MSLAGIVAPLTFTSVFAMTLNTVPGAAFLLAGAILAWALAIGWRSTARQDAAGSPG